MKQRTRQSPHRETSLGTPVRVGFFAFRPSPRLRRDRKGETLLMWAAKASNIKVLLALLPPLIQTLKMMKAKRR